MAALSGEKTVAELSAEFGVHPTMISNWKHDLVKRAEGLFARGSKPAAVEDARRVFDDLHRKIGQLQVERDFPYQALGWRTPDEAYLGQSTTVTAPAA